MHCLQTEILDIDSRYIKRYDYKQDKEKSKFLRISRISVDSVQLNQFVIIAILLIFYLLHSFDFHMCVVVFNSHHYCILFSFSNFECMSGHID